MIHTPELQYHQTNKRSIQQTLRHKVCHGSYDKNLALKYLELINTLINLQQFELFYLVTIFNKLSLVSKSKKKKY